MIEMTYEQKIINFTAFLFYLKYTIFIRQGNSHHVLRVEHYLMITFLSSIITRSTVARLLGYP